MCYWFSSNVVAAPTFRLKLQVSNTCHCPISSPVYTSRWAYLGMWLDLTTSHRQAWLFSFTSTYHSTDLLTACGVHPPGRPWNNQLGNDSTRPTGELWRRAVDRGHGGATTRRPSPATRPWWWWTLAMYYNTSLKRMLWSKHEHTNVSERGRPDWRRSTSGRWSSFVLWWRCHQETANTHSPSHKCSCVSYGNSPVSRRQQITLQATLIFHLIDGIYHGCPWSHRATTNTHSRPSHNCEKVKVAHTRLPSV